MLYALAGGMVGAIFIRIIILLKRRADLAEEREQMAARLNQLAL